MSENPSSSQSAGTGVFSASDIPRRMFDRRAQLNSLTRIPSKIPYEELPRAKLELPKRQHRGDYRDSDYPFSLIPEFF